MEELSRYFDMLEVRRGASLEEIKRAYRDLAQVWHPDRYCHNPRLRAKAEEKLKSLNEAYQRLSEYCERSAASTPPPASQSSTSNTDRKQSRETKRPPKASPPPQPNPDVNRTKDTSDDDQRSNTNIGCILIALFVFGFIIIIVSGENQNSSVQPQFQTPPQQPPTVNVEQEALSQMKAQIEDRVTRKDAEFDRLEKWYQRGVSAQEEAGYRASLVRAQQEEHDIEKLTLTYNAKKKELDAKILSK